MTPRAKAKAVDLWALARLVDRMAVHTAVCSHAARGLDRRPMIMVDRDDFLRALAIAQQLLSRSAPSVPRSYEAGWNDAINEAEASVLAEARLSRSSGYSSEALEDFAAVVRALKRPAPVDGLNVAAGQGSLVGIEPACPHVFARGKRCAVCGEGVKAKRKAKARKR